jgi:AspT/YidE/YbjL antiporter-like protein
VAAILLSWLGRIGRVVWYMPSGANLALRELGIVLFLACVGLKAGSRFMETLLSQDGPFGSSQACPSPSFRCWLWVAWRVFC